MNTIIILCVTGLLTFIGFGLYKANDLKHIQIIQSVTIKGSSIEVFDMVRYLKNFPKWSPFLAADPTQKYKIIGTDGLVGARYHWDGNGGKDLGLQEIVKIDELKFVGMKCDIQKPFVAKPTFDYYFTQTANGIEVRQDFKVESDLTSAFFMWLFGAKADMAKMNHKGLDLMKAAIELK